MTIDRLINIVVTITLIEMMVAIGMSVTLDELLRFARNGRLIARAALANYVCVPAVTVGLLLLFRPHPMIATGFLILAVCPGAPFGPPVSAIAKGNVSVAVGLMVILAGSSAILAPVFLHILLPIVSGDQLIQIDAIKIVAALLMTQLAPLCVGLAARRWRPHWADRWQQPATQLSKALNLLAVGMILLAHWDLLATIRPRGLVGMLTLLIASWASGWFLGGSEATARRTMTLTTSLRNVGVGLVIATGAFAGTPAVTAIVVYGLIEIFGSLLLAIVWSRREGAAHAPSL